MTYRLILAVIACSLVASVLNAQQGNRRTTGGTDPTDVHQLLNQRVKVLQQLADLTRRAFEVGEASFDAVIEADDHVLEAQLDSATTNRQRVALYEERLELAHRREDQISRRVGQGTLGLVAKLQAESDRLKIAITLQRLRDSANDMPAK